MPIAKKNAVVRACDASIDKLRAAQRTASPLEWRRLQHAISRLALAAGHITPLSRETKKEKAARLAAKRAEKAAEKARRAAKRRAAAAKRAKKKKDE